MKKIHMTLKEFYIKGRDETKVPISLIYKKGINLRSCSIVNMVMVHMD